MEILLQELPIAILMGVIGAIVFSLIGVASFTDETATLAPLTLIVILLGVPPAGIFTFFLAGAIAKHMAHVVPTMLVGIPGDTLAVPLLDDSARMRILGLPHVAVRKAVAGAVIASFISVVAAVIFASLLSPFADLISAIAPWLFLVAALAIAYASQARWAGVLALVPFVALILGLRAWTGTFDVTLTISFFIGIAIGPMLVDVFSVLVPANREELRRKEPAHVFLAPDRSGRRSSSRRFPNPLRVLDRRQVGAVAATATVSSATFMFSPVAMTILMGELVRARVKQGYQRLSTTLAAKNGTTESTYISELLIPLIAFGLPLSPLAAGPAFPLFNAPPVFETNPEEGIVNNLSTYLSTSQFFVYGLASAAVAALITYPFVMRYAHLAAKFVMTRVSHEAIISSFVALVLVVGLWEGGILGLIVALSVGFVGGMLIKLVKVHAGVLFMGFYVAILSVPSLLALAG